MSYFWNEIRSQNILGKIVPTQCFNIDVLSALFKLRLFIARLSCDTCVHFREWPELP
jgi:hypothetical protein